MNCIVSVTDDESVSFYSNSIFIFLVMIYFFIFKYPPDRVTLEVSHKQHKLLSVAPLHCLYRS